MTRQLAVAGLTHLASSTAEVVILNESCGQITEQDIIVKDLVMLIPAFQHHKIPRLHCYGSRLRATLTRDDSSRVQSAEMRKPCWRSWASTYSSGALVHRNYGGFQLRDVQVTASLLTLLSMTDDGVCASHTQLGCQDRMRTSCWVQLPAEF